MITIYFCGYIIIKEVDKMENKELVLKTLKESSEPLKSKDIADKSGLSKEEVDKVLKELKKEELVDSPKRCFYSAK